MSRDYSGTPLVKKLGIKPAMQVLFINAPDHYINLIGALPDEVVIHNRLCRDLSFIHYFAGNCADLEHWFPIMRDSLAKDGMLWVSWPKKASAVPTDVSDVVVREIGLANGLVDIKVAAIDETWSGLKFVWRKTDR